MAIHPRNARYKQNVLAAPYAICLERARYFTESYRRTEGEHPALRMAKAFDHTIRHLTVYILDEEKIIGNRSSKLVATVLPVERGDINTILEYELDLLTNRATQPYNITAAEKRELRNEILPYWRGKTVRDRKKALWDANGLGLHPAMYSPLLLRHLRHIDPTGFRSQLKVSWRYRLKLPRLLRELDYNNPAGIMNCFDVQGHMILGHKNILREGWVGVQRRAEKKLAALDESDKDGRAFLPAVIICCEAIRDLAWRFADRAERLARVTDDPARKADLLAAAARCLRVPYHPPRDFREALQAVWLTQVGALIAYGMAGIFAVGRIDQYLYPYFAADKQAGEITDDEAVEWLEELLIKLSYNLLMIPAFGKQTGSELGSDSNAPTVGGLGPDGEDATNDLSYLTLTAFANVKSMGNSFSIRLTKKSPAAWWRQALATYRSTSGAALLNDEVVVAALTGCGYSEAAARDYGIIGCVEPTGDGDTFGCTSGNDVSLVAPLEMALLDGALRIMGKRIGPRTGDPRSFLNFAQFMTAYKEQLRFLVATLAKAVNLKDIAYRENCPNPYVSATLTGCVEHARDMTAGGATYNFASISGRGLGTAVDSLAAIKHFVFDKHLLTMDELLALLNDNFGGDDITRLRLTNKAPKYGCGDECADALAAEVVDFFCGEVRKYKTIRGGSFRPGFFSYGMHVLDGMLLGATPNGRRVSEPVSNSFSPANGTEKRGITALLSSVIRIDHTAIANGLALNVKLSPALFRDDEHLDKMTALIKTYFAQGGMELSPNVISSATLRRAQANPNDFRDLVIRVSGYSAYFCDLGRALQNGIRRPRRTLNAPGRRTKNNGVGRLLVLLFHLQFAAGFGLPHPDGFHRFHRALQAGGNGQLRRRVGFFPHEDFSPREVHRLLFGQGDRHVDIQRFVRLQDDRQVGQVVFLERKYHRLRFLFLDFIAGDGDRGIALVSELYRFGAGLAGLEVRQAHSRRIEDHRHAHHALQGEGCFGIGRVVGDHENLFNLFAFALTDAEGHLEFRKIAGLNQLFRRFGHRAAAGALGVGDFQILVAVVVDLERMLDDAVLFGFAKIENLLTHPDGRRCAAGQRSQVDEQYSEHNAQTNTIHHSLQVHLSWGVS